MGSLKTILSPAYSVMSSGSRGSGRSFTGRGSSSQKRAKRKKQDYHKHRARLDENEGPVDFETLRDRTLQSLESLGHQVFHPDLGYGIDNWLKSLNVLLDDFESKASIGAPLPQDYLSRKREVMDKLGKPPEFPELDSTIAQAKGEEEQLAASLGPHGEAYFASRLASLKEQRNQTATELETERARLAEKKAEPRRQVFFRRIFASKEPVSSEPDLDVDQIEQRLGDLDSQIAAAEAEEALYGEVREKLARARQKVSELEAKRLERLQFIPEREEATRLLANEISKIRPS